MSGFIGEFIGTMILIILGTGCSAAVNLKNNYAYHQNWFFVTIAWGLAVTMGIYVANILGSLASLNPVVTIGLAILNKLPWISVIPYIIAELLGAFTGATIIAIFYYPQFKITNGKKEGNQVGIFATVPPIKNYLFNFLSEVIATFLFVLILFNMGGFTKGLKPLIVGLLISSIGMSLGGTTGFALNPARDFAPRFAYYILPIPNKSSAQWSYAWIPIIGPFVGGILATLLTIVL